MNNHYCNGNVENSKKNSVIQLLKVGNGDRNLCCRRDRNMVLASSRLELRNKEVAESIIYN